MDRKARTNEGEAPGMRVLPTVRYRGKVYTVDFRLEEMRQVTGQRITFVPFREITDEKLKRQLRGMRTRWQDVRYMKGLDD